MVNGVRAHQIIDLIEQIAPLSLAEDWDNSGWQVGDPQAPVRSVIVALDLTPEVITEAKRENAELILTHHPFLFKPLRSVRLDQPTGKMLRELIRSEIMLYSAHTSFDNAPGGVSQLLGEKLGILDLQVLGASRQEKLYKLVVFVPDGHQDEVRMAISTAGAGWIGNYSHCTFQTAGIGTFLPLSGASPFIGQTGQLEKAAEYRLETIVPESVLNQVLRALLQTHPYEEVAYDLYPLSLPGKAYGPGRIGNLAQSMEVNSLAELVKKTLKADGIKIIGQLEQPVEKIAVVGGSGAFLIPEAASRGAQVMITGDVKYHEAQEANALGLTVLDAGHRATEMPAVEYLNAFLQEKFPELRFKTASPQPCEFWL